MLDLIMQFQNHLATEGRNINNVTALFLGLITLVITGYLIESEK